MDKCKYQVEFSFPFTNVISNMVEIERQNDIIDSEICCDIDTFVNGFIFYKDDECVSDLIASIMESLSFNVAGQITLINIKRI